MYIKKMKKLYEPNSFHSEPSNVFIQQVDWSGAGILQWNYLEPSADVIVTAREQGDPFYRPGVAGAVL